MMFRTGGDRDRFSRSHIVPISHPPLPLARAPRPSWSSFLQGGGSTIFPEGYYPSNGMRGLAIRTGKVIHPGGGLDPGRARGWGARQCVVIGCAIVVNDCHPSSCSGNIGFKLIP